MAVTKIGNTSMDMLNKAELYEQLNKTQEAWFAERARGVKPMNLPVTIATIASGSVTLPPSGPTRLGPKQGFTWIVKRLSVTGLATNDVLNVYVNSATAMGFVDTITATKPAIYPEEGLMLEGGEYLIVSGSSLSATGDLAVTGQIVETPTVDVWKVLGA